MSHRRARNGRRARDLAGLDALHAASRSPRRQRRLRRDRRTYAGRDPCRRSPWPGVTRAPLLVGDSAAYGAMVDPGTHPRSERPWRELIVPPDQLEAAVGDRPLAACGHPKPYVWPRGVRVRVLRLTTRRSFKRSTGCPRRFICTRGAIAGRRPSRGLTILAGRRDGWCSAPRWLTPHPVRARR